MDICMWCTSFTKLPRMIKCKISLIRAYFSYVHIGAGEFLKRCAPLFVLGVSNGENRRPPHTPKCIVLKTIIFKEHATYIHMQDLPKYRVECRKKDGKSDYYLVKDIYLDGTCSRVTKYMGCRTTPPTDKEIKEFTVQNILELETRAKQKIVESRLKTLRTSHLSPELAARLEEIRYFSKYLNSVISDDDIKIYEQTFEEQYIHGTTAIEGNTLTLHETIDLLQKGTIPKGKALREINEVQNYKRVAKYRNEYHGRVTLEFIQKIHELIMANILEEPGEFRMSDGIIISGYDYQLTPALLIEDELTALIDEYYARISDKCHPFESAVWFHYKFETIHPFIDGNGRVGRELLNYLLTTSGYPRLLIMGDRRNEYLGALKAGNVDDFTTMIQTFAEMLISQRKDAIEQNLQNIPNLVRHQLKKKTDRL